MNPLFDVIRYVGDLIAPFANIIQVAGGIAAIGAVVLSWLTRREVRRQRAEGEHYDNVKLQTHEVTQVGPGHYRVGIRDIDHTTLDEMLVGADLADAVEDAARAWKRTSEVFPEEDSSIFRMPTIDEHNHLYRDVIGRYGRMMPDEALPYVVSVLCEPTAVVVRKMLRCVGNEHDTYKLIAQGVTLETENGLGYQRPRLRALTELAMLIANHDFDKQPWCYDKDGYVVAARVMPGRATMLG